MVRATVLYEREPDAARYAQHIDEFVTPVECLAFRHGRAFGSPFGEPAFAYYAEFEWADMDAFRRAAGTDAFAAAGRDAAEMGIPFTVTFTELS